MPVSLGLIVVGMWLFGVYSSGRGDIYDIELVAMTSADEGTATCEDGQAGCSWQYCGGIEATFFDADLRWLSHYGFAPLAIPSMVRGL